MPLDADDQGLDPVGANVALADIHSFFEGQVQAREVREARRMLEQRGE